MLIAVVEVLDQFERVDEIESVNDDQKSMKEFENSRSVNDYSTNVIKFYRIENWKRELEFLNDLLSNYTYSSNDIYSWMEENENNLVSIERS